MVYFCSGDSVLCLYFNEINGCGIVLQGQFHALARLGRPFCQALPKQVEQPDANDAFGLDEDFVMGWVGIDGKGQGRVVVNVEKSGVDDDLLLGIAATVPSPCFQGRRAR